MLLQTERIIKCGPKNLICNDQKTAMFFPSMEEAGNRLKERFSDLLNMDSQVDQSRLIQLQQNPVEEVKVSISTGKAAG